MEACTSGREGILFGFLHPNSSCSDSDWSALEKHTSPRHKTGKRSLQQNLLTGPYLSMSVGPSLSSSSPDVSDMTA